MLSRSLWATMLGLCFLAGCNISIDGSNVSTSDGYSFDFEGVQANKKSDDLIPETTKRVELTNRFGEVQIRRVEAGAKPSLTWEATCWADSQGQAEAFVAEMQMKTEVSGDGYHWSLVLPNADGDLKGVRSNVVCNVPEDMIAKVTNEHGDVRVLSIDGAVEVKNSFGAIELRGLGGTCNISNQHGDTQAEDVYALTLESKHGDCSVTNVATDFRFDGEHADVTAKDIKGSVDIKTSFDDIVASNIAGKAKLRNKHGDINVSEMQGAEFEAFSSFGDITALTNATTVKCENSHGEIKVHALNSQLKSLNASGSFDDITVTLPTSCSPQLSTSVSHGDIENEFDQTAEASSGNSPRIQLTVKHGDLNIKRGS